MKIIAEWREEDYKNGKKDGITEGIEKGINEGIIKTAKNMIKENYPVEEIMKITKLNKETILNL